MSMNLSRFQTKNKATQSSASNTHKAPVSTESPANQVPQSTVPKCAPRLTEEGDIHPMTSVSSANAITLEYLDIPIDQIDFARGGYRYNSDNKSLRRLADSIRDYGLLHAIVVRREGNRYKIVLGNRRVVACDSIGLKVIHARVEPTESNTHAFPIIENIKRSDYDPISFAIEIHKRLTSLKPGLDLDALIKLFNNTHRQIKNQKNIDATVTSILEETECSASTIRNHLDLLKLPDHLRRAIEDNKLTPTLGYVFANNMEHPAFDANCQKALKEKMKRSTLEELFKAPVTSQASADQVSAAARQLLKQIKDIKNRLKKRSGDLSNDDANNLLSEVMLIKEIIEDLRSKAGLGISHLSHEAP
ncbi:MAG: chromosome partitioning protein ParB family [Syntrophaceae bacterium]|nr:MAG: chromosome partitioning protein ParB family [Syntrophaceae bacterium]